MTSETLRLQLMTFTNDNKTHWGENFGVRSLNLVDVALMHVNKTISNHLEKISSEGNRVVERNKNSAAYLTFLNIY